VHSHVLSDFAKEDQHWVAALCEAVAITPDARDRRDSTFQNRCICDAAKGFFDKGTRQRLPNGTIMTNGYFRDRFMDSNAVSSDCHVGTSTTVNA